MKLKQQESSNNITLAQIQSTKLSTLLQDTKLQVQQISMQKKVLLEMRKNLKADKVVYEQRKLAMERELNSAQKELSILHKKEHNIVNEANKCGKIYQKLTKEISFQQRQRDDHLRGLESLIEQKQRCNFDEIAREKVLLQIAEKAFQSKQESQIQWSNVYLVNVMVNRMLRNKIDKEMAKFSVIEFAFKNIKSATGVSDAKTFVKKYLNKQSQYGNLLGRITVNENKINELKEEKQSLIQQYRRIEYEKQTFDHMKIKDVEISNEMNTLIALEAQKKNIDIQYHKMRLWLGRESKKFLSIQKGLKIDQKIATDQLSLKNSFIDICKNILQILGNTGKQQFQQLTQVSDLSGRDSARVTRMQQKKSMKSCEEKEVLEGEEEQEIILSAECEQKQMIAAQRQELIRSNSKFMKQARKRLEEKKKLEIEKGSDNKKKKF